MFLCGIFPAIQPIVPAQRSWNQACDPEGEGEHLCVFEYSCKIVCDYSDQMSLLNLGKRKVLKNSTKYSLILNFNRKQQTWVAVFLLQNLTPICFLFFKEKELIEKE